MSFILVSTNYYKLSQPVISAETTNSAFQLNSTLGWIAQPVIQNSCEFRID